MGPHLAPIRVNHVAARVLLSPARDVINFSFDHQPAVVLCAVLRNLLDCVRLQPGLGEIDGAAIRSRASQGRLSLLGSLSFLQGEGGRASPCSLSQLRPLPPLAQRRAVGVGEGVAGRLTREQRERCQSAADGPRSTGFMTSWQRVAKSALIHERYPLSCRSEAPGRHSFQAPSHHGRDSPQVLGRHSRRDWFDSTANPPGSAGQSAGGAGGVEKTREKTGQVPVRCPGGGERLAARPKAPGLRASFARPLSSPGRPHDAARRRFEGRVAAAAWKRSASFRLPLLLSLGGCVKLVA